MIGFTTLLLTLAALARAAPCNGPAQVVDNCRNSGQVALTFDDGPYQWEMDVVRALNGGKGTFFLNGDNYGCIYDHADTVLQLYRDGHTLGSHTWSHPDLTTLDYNGVDTELRRVEEAFIKILGVKPLYFRPPFGSINDQVIQVLKDRGYTKVFLWSKDTGDANGASVSSSKSVMDQVINSYNAPQMVLSHSTIQTTSSQVLPYAVPKLQAKGYKLVTADQCMGDSWPYVYFHEPGVRDSSWHC